MYSMENDGVALYVTMCLGVKLSCITVCVCVCVCVCDNKLYCQSVYYMCIRGVENFEFGTLGDKHQNNYSSYIQ